MGRGGEPGLEGDEGVEEEVEEDVGEEVGKG